MSLPNRWAWGFIALAVITLLVYWPGMQGGFYFDDEPNIIDPPGIHWQQINLASWRGLIKETLIPGRPVSNLSFALNHLFWGLDPQPYHWTNLLIHLLAGFVLWRMFSQYLKTHANHKYHNSGWLALTGTAIFLLHPLNIQAVTYVVQRMASLTALFGFIAFFAYLKFRDGGHRGWLVFVFGGLLLSIASKENGLLWVGVFVLYDYAFYRKQWLGYWARATWPLRSILAAGLLLAVALTIWLALPFLGASGFSYFVEPFPNRDFNALERLLTQFRVQIHYLWLLLAPLPSALNLDHQVLVSTSLLNPLATLPAMLVMLCWLVASIFLLHRWPAMGFPLMAYHWLHLMESWAPIGLELMFEHRMYQPMPFLLLGLMIGVQQYKKRFAGWQVGGVVCVLALLAVANWQRNLVWGDTMVFLEDCAVKSPQKFRPQYNFGSELGRRGELQRAEQFLRQATVLDPLQSPPYNQLGNIYLLRKDDQQAHQFYQKAVDLNPLNYEARYNLAVVAQRLNFWPQAIENYRFFAEQAPAVFAQQKHLASQLAISLQRRLEYQSP